MSWFPGGPPAGYPKANPLHKLIRDEEEGPPKCVNCQIRPRKRGSVA